MVGKEAKIWSVDEFTVPKMLLAYALHAGYQMAVEDLSNGG